MKHFQKSMYFWLCDLGSGTRGILGTLGLGTPGPGGPGSRHLAPSNYSALSNYYDLCITRGVDHINTIATMSGAST